MRKRARALKPKSWDDEMKIAIMASLAKYGWMRTVLLQPEFKNAAKALFVFVS